MSAERGAPWVLMLAGALLPLHGQVQIRKQVSPAGRPPASVRPAAATRQSTALAAAARNNPERPKELPSLSLMDADGKTVDGSTLARKSHWLLLYRRAACVPCDNLMTGLQQDSTFQHGSAISVVVEGASPAALAALRTQFPEWSSATWAADPHGTAAEAMKVRGTPTLYGMHGVKVVFAQAGVPGGAAQASGAAMAWTAKKFEAASEEKQ